MTPRSLSQSPGTAVMISHHQVRFTQTAQCFAALALPAGSRAEHFAAGLDLSQAREDIAADLSGEWLFFVDDDHLFEPDMAMRLLRRLDEYPDVDVVSALVLRRWPPHYTVAGRLIDDKTASIVGFANGSTGLARVDLTGLGGGAVIRRSAFDRFARPWFMGGAFTEDWTFCSRLKQAGGQSAVDLDVLSGHNATLSVWPTREENGEWGVSYVPVRTGSQAALVADVKAAATLSGRVAVAV